MKKAIVLQSGGCTAVINQSLCGVVSECRKNNIEVFGLRYGVRGLIESDFIDMSLFSDETLQQIANLPSAFLGSSRTKLDEEAGLSVVEQLHKRGIVYAFLIGGNDTAVNADVLAKSARRLGIDFQVIGIPKTIDNDLPFMHYCPGYGSVARFTAITAQEAGLDTLAMKYVDPVKVIEVMGRNAGWIVASSALLKKRGAQPPHILCFPEVAFNWGRFLDKVERVYRKTGYVVIVMSETIRDENGVRIGEKKEGLVKDGFGHPYVESPAQRICSVIEKQMHIRARYDKPGTIQRMSIAYVSKRDQEDAFNCGVYAVKLAMDGETGLEVILKDGGKFDTAPIREIASVERKLPEEFITEDGFFITKKFIDYALPLIGGDLPDYDIAYENLS